MKNENRGPDVGEMAVDAMVELEHLMGTGEVVITGLRAGHGLKSGSLDINYRIVPGADPVTACEGLIELSVGGGGGGPGGGGPEGDVADGDVADDDDE